EGAIVHYAGAFSQYLNHEVRTDSIAHMQSDLRKQELMTEFLCPQDEQTTPVLLMHSSENKVVTGRLGGWAQVSYGPNTALTGYFRGIGAAGEIDLVETPSTVLFLADSRSPYSWGWNVLGAPTNTTTLYDLVYNGTYGQRLDILRHEGGISVLFVDGHGKHVTLDEMQEVGISKGIKSR
ncbi:MAG: hypothetical protein HQL32_15430, partial [Planctomycetes bacterium]|nr:hypothetical protein [Planctomycetota bacterium]